MNKHLLFIFLAAVLLGQTANAAVAAGDYKSRKSGNWASPLTWAVYDGAHWAIASHAPSNADGAIVISAGDSVTVTDATTADQVAVSLGAVLNITNASTFTLMNSPGADMKVGGKVIVGSSSSIANDPGIGGSSIDYKGDVFVQNGGCQLDLLFDGPNTQTITGQGYNGVITVKNPNNIILAGSQSYNGVAFLDGKINATGLFVTTQYSANFTGANSNRYIMGNFILIVYDDNVTLNIPSLPIGSATHYQPVTLSVNKNNGQQTDFTINVHDGAPPAGTLPATLKDVSAVSYVSITNDRPGTIVSASLRLDYNADDMVTDYTRLRIAENIGGTWTDLGGKANKATAGKITTTVNFTEFGDFALASTFGKKVLPLNRTISSGSITLPDFYTIPVNADGDLTVQLASTNSTGISLDLLDGDSTTNLATLTLGGNASANIQKAGLAAGNYFVRITPAAAGAPYTYTVGNTLDEPAEANDINADSSAATANLFLTNSTQTGHVGYYYKNERDTADWYKIKTDHRDTLKVWLTSANSNALSANIYASDGTTWLGSLTAPGNGTGMLAIRVTKPKDLFFVKVKAANAWQFAPYTIANSLGAAPPALTAINAAQDASSLTAAKGKDRIIDVLPYPNPAAKQFRIQLNGAADGTVALALKNVSGKTVWANAKANISSLSSITVDVSRLPNGTYFLEITGEDKKVITKKVVVAR